MKFGIDVSKWNGEFNFKQAKSEGVEFVILRGAYARRKDTKFEKYYSDCKTNNLPIGVYHYSMATTTAEAEAEAKFLYENALKGKQFELPIYIDVEDKTQLALSKRLLTDIVKTWCNYLETRKFYVGIYAGVYTCRDNLIDSELQRYTHWIPQWGQKCTYPNTGVLGMWQFGGETNKLRDVYVAGGVTDQNYLYQDFTPIIKAKKLNGYGSQGVTQTPVKTPVNVSESKFKAGDKVKLKTGATYYNGVKIPTWVLNSVLYIRGSEFPDRSYNISTLKSGAITGRVNKKYLTKY